MKKMLLYFLIVSMIPVVLSAQVEQADFLGSDACLVCHQSPMGEFQAISPTDMADSFHSKKLRDADEANLIPALMVGGDFDWNTQSFSLSNSAGDKTVAIVLTKVGDVFNVSVDGTVHEVKYFLGGAGWKQRYITQIGASVYILPIQFNLKTSEWVDYHIERWKEGEDTNTTTATPLKSRSYDKNCAGCHTTGTEVELIGDEYVATWSEMFVGCEACHGAGGPSTTPHSGSGGNPADLTGDRALEVCGQCHGRGKDASGTYGFPWDTAQGIFGSMPYNGVLAEYYVQAPGLWGGGESSSHHQQYNDFVTSGHYSTPYADINCFTCHDPHAPSGSHQVRTTMVEDDVTITTENDDDTLCLSCHAGHGDFDGLTPEIIAANDPLVIGPVVSGHTNHTYDPTNQNDTGGASRCSKCHMPKVAKSGIAYDIHNHSFTTMNPQATLTYEQPNACAASCHRSTDGDSYGTLFDGITDVSLTDWTETTDVALATALSYWDRNLFGHHRFEEKNPVLNSEFVADAPIVDGDVSDWSTTEWLDVEIADGNTVSLKARVTDTEIYVAAKWADATMSMTRGGKVYADGTWTKISGQAEDRLALMWNMGSGITDFTEKGCTVKCHFDVDGDNSGTAGSGDVFLDEAGETGDIWHMKAHRALGATSSSQVGPLTVDAATYEVTAGKITMAGYMEDNVVTDAGRSRDAGSSTYNANYSGDIPTYIETAPTDFIDAMVMTLEETTNGEAVLVSGLSVAEVEAAWAVYASFGACVPERYLAPGTESNLDLIQAAVWEDGYWYTEITRLLDTGNSDDVTFAHGTDYYFGVALMDNGGGTDHITTAGMAVKMTIPLTVSVGDERPGIPSDYKLSQNYPNPFNPVTTIKYSLSKMSNVSLRVYNSIGQLVKTLVAKEESAGEYNVTWDGTNAFGQIVSSGVYLYRLEAGGLSEVKKMILLK